MMIGKTKKHIIYSAEDKVLNIDQKDIEQYLSEVKDAVEKAVSYTHLTLPTICSV